LRHPLILKATREGRTALFAVALLGAAPSCRSHPSRLHPSVAESAEKHDALALSDALEALIAEGKDTPEDRAYAYRQVRTHEEPTAAYAFARAAVTGRFVQTHGLTKGPLVAEVERFARQSRALDPGFRNGAATRMLGTLYVIAPAALLKHGNSEDGLALLEGLVKAHPEVLENHLRVAEALIALGDAAPARPHLCRCLEKKAALRRDDQRLLDRLVTEAGSALRCEQEAAPPSASPAASPPSK
jgi:hypothetical protein